MRRLAREDWIAAARKVLVATGIDDVKVDQLARKMRMTRGSFYWHFKHRKDLLDALLSDWEGRNYFEIAQVRAQWAENGASLTDVISIWLSEDRSFPAFDMAVRVWARKAKPVADSVKRVDDAWIHLLTGIFADSAYGPDESLVRARIIYYHQVGYYALNVSEPMSERIRLLSLYYTALTGQPAPANLQSMVEKRSESAKRTRKRAVLVGPEATADVAPAKTTRKQPVAT